MSTFVVANKDAKQEFKIPVTWSVYDTIKVQANSLQEALEYVENHIDEIPLGTDPEYVDGSYEISLNGFEEAIIFQNTKDVICMEFNCNKDLSKYTDSMLFDNCNIANGLFVYKNDEMKISLDICGEVEVHYNGQKYKNASDFPKELKERIKKYPNEWDILQEDEDEKTDIPFVEFNNWFEYLFEGDGYVFEGDLSKTTPEKILEDMTKIVRQYFGLNKED